MSCFHGALPLTRSSHDARFMQNLRSKRLTYPLPSQDNGVGNPPVHRDPPKHCPPLSASYWWSSYPLPRLIKSSSATTQRHHVTCADLFVRAALLMNTGKFGRTVDVSIRRKLVYNSTVVQYITVRWISSREAKLNLKDMKYVRTYWEYL